MFLFSYIAASSVKSKQNIKTKPPFIPKSLYRNKKKHYSQPAVSFKILTKIKQKQYSQTPADSKICLVKTNKVKVLLARKLCNRKKNNYNQIPADSKEFLEKTKIKSKCCLPPNLLVWKKQSTTVKLLLPGILFIVKNQWAGANRKYRIDL